jgi:hypothetical protein
MCYVRIIEFVAFGFRYMFYDRLLSVLFIGMSRKLIIFFCSFSVVNCKFGLSPITLIAD